MAPACRRRGLSAPRAAPLPTARCCRGDRRCCRRRGRAPLRPRRAGRPATQPPSAARKVDPRGPGRARLQRRAGRGARSGGAAAARVQALRPGGGARAAGVAALWYPANALTRSRAPAAIAGALPSLARWLACLPLPRRFAALRAQRPSQAPPAPPSRKPKRPSCAQKPTRAPPHAPRAAPQPGPEWRASRSALAARPRPWRSGRPLPRPAAAGCRGGRS
jgi:hypothetical protein